MAATYPVIAIGCQAVSVCAALTASAQTLENIDESPAAGFDGAIVDDDMGGREVAELALAPQSLPHRLDRLPPAGGKPRCDDVRRGGHQHGDDSAEHRSGLGHSGAREIAYRNCPAARRGEGGEWYGVAMSVGPPGDRELAS